MYEDNGEVCYLDCANGFMGISICLTHQIVHFKLHMCSLLCVRYISRKNWKQRGITVLFIKIVM